MKYEPEVNLNGRDVLSWLRDYITSAILQTRNGENGMSACWWLLCGAF